MRSEKGQSPGKGHKMKVVYYKQWQGYLIRIERKGRRPLWVRSYRNGKYNLFLDYTFAAHYTEKTAAAHAARLAEQLKAGQVEGIRPGKVVVIHA